MKAQWYVDGAAHGAAIPLTAAANIPAGANFLVGKHTSNSSSFAYNIDEYRFCSRAASPAEIKAWHSLPHAASGRLGTVCGIKHAGRGAPTAGNALYSLSFSGPSAGYKYLLVIGARPQVGFDMGLAFPALKGCTWYTSFDVDLIGATGSSGRVTFPGGIPNSSSLAGLGVDTQVLGFVGSSPSKKYQSNAMSHKIELN